MNIIWIFYGISFFALQCWSDIIYPRSLDSHNTKKCVYIRTHGMLGVDCNDLKLKDVPTNLRGKIEVLDVSSNRIREIFNTSFENYPYLKILYLTDNAISYIEHGAFAPISDLEILDLTLNSLHMIPEALENLPFLRTLMLGSNPFADVIFSKSLPSVQYLSLSSCKLKKFPDFSNLPSLMQLNVSGNNLQTIEMTQIAPMCSLKLLDLRKNKKLFRREHCKCQLLLKWFADLSRDGFKLLPELGELCRNTTEGWEVIEDSETCFSNATVLILGKSGEIRRMCQTEMLKYGSGPLQLRGSARWVLIAIICLAIIIVCACSLYYMRKRHIKRRKNRTQQRTTISKSASSRPLQNTCGIISECFCN